MDMSIEDDTDIIDYKQKYEILFKEHENCLKVVEKQKLQLSKVKPVEKDSENQRIEVASNVCFMCKKCNDTFTTQDLLNVHEKFSHAPQEKIKCELCEEIFDSENDVQRHVHQRHGDRNQFNCKNCSFQGNSGLDLKNHSIKCKYTTQETPTKPPVIFYMVYRRMEYILTYTDFQTPTTSAIHGMYQELLKDLALIWHLPVLA